MAKETQKEHDNVDQATSSASMLSGRILAKRVVWYIVGVIEGFLILRFILLLLGANRGNGFVDLVYGISGFFAAPFFTVFNHTPTYGASIIEISSILAMVVYAIIGWALGDLFTIRVKDKA